MKDADEPPDLGEALSLSLHPLFFSLKCSYQLEGRNFIMEDEKEE